MLALFVAGAAALGLARGEEPSAEQAIAATEPGPDPAPIARRVERLRALDFEELPRVRTTNAEGLERKAAELEQSLAAEEGLSLAEKEKEERAVAAGEALLRLAGLIPDDFELEDAASGVEGLIGGFYLPEETTVYLVDDPILFASEKATEEKLAHELVHALEDQAHGLLEATRDPELSAEEQFALSALLEGTATFVERLYLARHLGGGVPFTGSLRNFGPENLGTGLPPALVAIVRFPYTSGAVFVRELYRQSGDWDLVEEAFEDPPVTSEEVLHPDKWVADEGRARVATSTLGAPGGGWEPVGADQLGEFDTALILALGAGAASAQRAAAGWEGAAFEVWKRSGADPECAGPCRAETAAAAGFRWERPADAAEFSLAAREYAERGLFAEPAGPLVWRIDDGFFAVGAASRASGLGFAPTAEQASQLAANSASG